MLRTLIFFAILFAMIFGNLFWWRHAHRSSRSRAVRWIAGVWAVLMLLGMVLLVVGRMPRMQWAALPWPAMVPVYIWHMLFMLPWVLWRTVRLMAVIAQYLFTRFLAEPAEVVEPSPAVASRRAFLATTAVLAPPVLASLAAWRAIESVHDFRTRRFELRIPNLPPALQGMTIAHLSDSHYGKFTDDRTFSAIINATNALKPDLVLFTGDLIDFNLQDLPGAMHIMRRLDPVVGTCLCEGNHDLFQSRSGFERIVRGNGFPMPINDAYSLTVRGVEVQLLGLRWGGPDLADRSLRSTEQDIADSVATVLNLRKPGAFPILLAHHPHAFDFLGSADVPLTLAGHTHGGQLNAGPIRPGKLRFRYLSGLYERAGKQLVVSNGVGNWFPLRVGAPAEIVHLTLKGTG